MHSLADCPLRTFCCITTADYAPFPILNIDFPALDLILSSLHPSTPARSASSLLLHSTNDKNYFSEEAILTQLRSRALLFLRGLPIGDLLIADHETCLVSADNNTDNDDNAVQSYIFADHLLQQLNSYTYNIGRSSTDSNNIARGFSQKARPTTTRRIHGCVHSSAISSSSYSPSSSRLSSHSPLFHSRTTTTASSSPSRSPARSQEQQLQDQIVPSWEGSSQESECSTVDRSFFAKESQHACRVYVLKDVTEMHSLALAARTDALKKERASASRRRSAVSMPSTWTHSPHTTPPTSTTTTTTTTTAHQQTLTIAASLAAGKEPNVTRQKLYPHKDTLDWSTGHSSHCHWASSHPPSSSASPCSCPIASSISSLSIEQQPTDPGLLLLHVTRFGTVDHAITISQQQQQSLSIHPNLLLDSQDGRMVTAMTNTSVMSYVHPDDTRALCQGLDRACKSLYTVFRVRWRLEGQEHLLDSDRQHFPFVVAKAKEGPVRHIEFQGESFEEYVDSTAIPEASLTVRVSNDGHTLAKYIWAEITGVLSSSQPLLVVRPLTSAELLDQAKEASLATAAAAAAAAAAATAAAASSSLIMSSRRSNARGQQLIQEKKVWKTKSKRMDLEEGMRMPKQLNLSALTSLSMSGARHHDEMGLRMPGSLPLSIQTSSQQLQQPSSSTQQLMTATRCRNHANPMPSFLAFPSNAMLPWSGMFVTIALDAWRQWILTVHAGQAQFKDWCEYLLDTTIDQMIESLSLGLTLLGIEEAPQSNGNTNAGVVGSYHQLLVEDGAHDDDQSAVQQRKTRQRAHQKTLEPWTATATDSLTGATATTYTTTTTTTTTTITYYQQQQQQKAARNQQTLSGLNRAGKILQSKYPSIEGVVRNISNSWLGQKVKTRLEQRLDGVADQVVDWWEAGAEVPLPYTSWSPFKRGSFSSSSESSSSGATVSELDESDALLMSEEVPVVVGVPCGDNNTPILVE